MATLHEILNANGLCVENLCVGTHIGKSNTIMESLIDFFEKNSIQTITKELRIYNGDDSPYKIPVQIFTGNPTSFHRKKIEDTEKMVTKKFIEKNGITMFIHSPYIVNLARPFDAIKVQLNLLQYDLELGSSISSKGVIVHCGKYLTMSIEESLENMKKNIQYCLTFATEECPFILETPAGQGTELLTKIEDFASFITSFTEEERKKIGICVDTCHVFATGYDPWFYLKELKKYGCKPHLVHFNDSKEECHSKKDRHEAIGSGKISIERLQKVAKRCIRKNIPMITE
jgi:deoxyribonuclease IV